MTTNADAYAAGLAAIEADDTTTKGQFADALRTVATAGFSDTEAKAWIDAIAVEYAALGITNADTYASLRSHIKSDGTVKAKALFDALIAHVAVLPETASIDASLRLGDLRIERDEIQASIDTLVGFKAGATQQVLEVLNNGIDQLRSYKIEVRNLIRGITGDPDN